MKRRRRGAKPRRQEAIAHLAGGVPAAGPIPAAQEFRRDSRWPIWRRRIKEKGVLSPILVRPLGADRL